MTNKFNYKLIFKIQGSLLLMEAALLLLSLLIGVYYQEDSIFSFAIAILVAMALGISGLYIGRDASPEIGKREGSLIVTSTWILFSLVGLLPFWVSGHILSFTDAFFETMSGFTTTGVSILDNIEEFPHCLLFWRSLTQWIGGLGIIVITMALLPIFGFTSVQLFSAESTGPTKDKIHPKISKTAKVLFLIYIILTTLETICLSWAGMSFFDAICHSFTTTATGGFSTKQNSIAYWNSPVIEYIIILFTIFSGINFSLYYFLFTLQPKRVFRNKELQLFLIMIAAATIAITISILNTTEEINLITIEKVFRESFFSVSSMMTTTGYTAYDYTYWSPFSWIVLLVLMISGASAGSTSGGVKVIRIRLYLQYCYYQFKSMIHPNAVFPIRSGGYLLKDDVIKRLLAYIILYVTLVIFGALVLSFCGLGFIESFSAMITSIGNVGPAFGSLGPTESFAGISSFSKWFLAISMLVGRLELFTVLLIFTPTFWRR